jgi:dienelactone hydrolase
VKRSLLALLALVAVAATACGDDADDASSSSDQPQTSGGVAPEAQAYEVDEMVETFVDPTRPTPEPSPAPERTLVTTIRYPVGDGPFPLIVFAHGFNGHPRKFVEVTTAWAERGYVVALPTFPLTNDEAPNGTDLADLPAQPGDMSFVLDEVLALNEEEGSALEGLIDDEHIGAGGLSAGGATTYGFVFHDCCRDARIDAAVVMAGIMVPFGEGEFDLSGVPLLVLHGDADPLLNYSNGVEAYAQAEPPKFFVTLIGGSHASPFEDDDTPYDALVATVTLDFWDAYLLDDAAGVDRLLADGNVPGLATVESDTG